MMPGYSATGHAPWAKDALSDQSTPDALIAVLNDPEGDRHTIIKVDPFDPDAAVDAEVNLKYADSDVPLDNHYRERLSNRGITWQARVGAEGLTAPGSSVSTGSIVLNYEREADEADEYTRERTTRYYWDCRPYEVLVGGPTFDEADYGTVLKGKLRDATWSDAQGPDALTLVMSDATLPLQQPLSQNTYAGDGAGDIEGDTDLKGVRRPLAFGECKNITPVRIDQLNRVYQWHDGLSSSLDAVYVLGSEYTAASGNPVDDVWDHTFTDDEVAGREYVYELDRSLVRFSTDLPGLVTLDVKGDATVATGGYLASAARIAEKMAITAGVTSGDIDGSSVNRTANLVPGAHGYYLPAGSDTTAFDAMQTVMGSIWGFVSYSRTGAIRVGRIGFDRTATRRIITEKVDSWTRLVPPQPVKTLSLRYGRSWTVQDEQSLALDVPESQPAHAAFVSQELRELAGEADSATTDDRLNATDLKHTTLFVNEGDAQVEQTRRFALMKGMLHIYRAVVEHQVYWLNPGDVIHITYDPWNIDQSFIVLGITDNTASQTTTLEILG